MRKFVFYILWFAMAALLVVLSLQFKHSSKAMVAQVESNVTAVSFQKAVRIKRLRVLPGQEIEKGDTLLEVERPDLLAEMQVKKSEWHQKQVEIHSAIANYQAQLDALVSNAERQLIQLQSEKGQLKLELEQDRRNALKFSAINESVDVTIDSVKLAQLDFLQSEESNLIRFRNLRKGQVEEQIKRDTFLLSEERRIIENEMAALELESAQLAYVATNAGTIGNVFVQLNELIPPFQTILSIYALQPTMIKAFVNERDVSILHVGDAVRVESPNKQYDIEGKIVEIGGRITDYPEKINPTIGITSYGQEVFVRIPADNEFLNGEKVFVYLLNGKK